MSTLNTVQEIEKFKKNLHVGDKMKLDCMKSYHTGDDIALQFQYEKEFEITGIFPHFVTINNFRPNAIPYIDLMYRRCIL